MRFAGVWVLKGAAIVVLLVAFVLLVMSVHTAQLARRLNGG